jgi:zinc protease
MRKVSLQVLFFFFALPVCSWTHTLPAAPVLAASPSPPAAFAASSPTIPIDARVQTGQLPNGLHYFVLPHKKPEHRAYFWLVVNAGSAQEDEDQRGLAHFVEHMGFDGTRRFPKRELTAFF